MYNKHVLVQLHHPPTAGGAHAGETSKQHLIHMYSMMAFLTNRVISYTSRGEGGCRLGLGRVKSFVTWMNKGWERGWYARARRVQGGQGLIHLGRRRVESTVGAQ